MSEGKGATHLRYILDMAAPATAAERITLFSQVASLGFDFFPPSEGRALQCAFAIEAEKSEMLDLLELPAERQEAIEIARRQLELGRALLTNRWNTVKLDAREAQSLTELQFKVVALLSDGLWKEAIQFAEDNGLLATEGGTEWSLSLALMKLRQGSYGEVRVHLERSIKKLFDRGGGIYDEGYWSTFESISGRDGHFQCWMGLVLINLNKYFALEDILICAFGLHKAACKNGVESSFVLHEAIVGMETILSSPKVVRSVSPNVIKKGFIIVKQLSEQYQAAIRLSATQQVQDSATDFAERSRLFALRMISRLEFAKGNTDEAIKLWNSTAENSTAFVRRSEPKNVVGALEIATLSSVTDFEIFDSRPQRRTLMSRVDPRPVISNFGFESSFSMSLDSASVITGSRHGSIFWYVLTNEGAVICDGLNIHPRFHFGDQCERFLSISIDSKAMVSETDISNQKVLNQPAVLIGGVDNYYHWTMEYLPKIHIILDKIGNENLRNFKFLVNHNLSEAQIGSLLRAGIPIENLFPVKGGTEVICKSLFVPSIPSPYKAVSYLRELMGVSEYHEQSSGRKVFVSRLDAAKDRRRVANEERVAEKFLAAGFELLIPTEVGLEAQIEMFASADVVVGAHGAALTNLAYCREGTVAVEVVNNTNAEYEFFAEIANIVGLQYARYKPKAEIAMGEPENAASIIDVDDLLDFCRSLGRARVEIQKVGDV